MNRAVMLTLLRLRRLACEDARRTLATRLQEEDATRAALAAAEGGIVRERAAAAAPGADDAMAEAFAAWLPHGLRARAQADDSHQRAGAATAEARSALAMARTNAEAAERLLAVHDAHHAIKAARRAQAAMDEAASRSARRP
ncbi:conserved protein of unknown function [Rhodovastum atsumiense]|uniref:Flagellar FliJ protein n=1 Tax=Rhodovastum atsumiense TaxID=504468 RepID=A0A5M6IRN2_9PROT|nr:flagellar FliJ family protein [Rhodovastum atsumiense]KAA5610228.1 hypothetical protein F1189_20455 [Rhodovastum atsumiense]CAH2604154.1 conserved protein of unknown function [Rhodovastum atsumiense]